MNLIHSTNEDEEEMKELLEQERIIDQEITDDLEKFKMEKELGGLELDDSSEFKYTEPALVDDFEINES